MSLQSGAALRINAGGGGEGVVIRRLPGGGGLHAGTGSMRSPAPRSTPAPIHARGLRERSCRRARPFETMIVQIDCLSRMACQDLRCLFRSGISSRAEQEMASRQAPVDSRRVSAVTRPQWTRVRVAAVPGVCQPPQRMGVEQMPTGRHAGGLWSIPLLLLPAVLTGKRDDVHQNDFPSSSLPRFWGDG